MIKFFRRIRQRLLREGLFSSYIFYALGEIVLVVVGILIALQVNTWNEDRKSKMESFELLANVRTDFIQAIDELESKNRHRKNSLNANTTLADYLGKDLAKVSDQKLDTLLGFIIVTPTYNGKSQSLSILFNTGKINLIKNKRLKELLFLWPQELEDMTEGELSSSLYKDQIFFPLIKKYAFWNNIISTLNSENWDFQHRPSKFERDYKALLMDKDFENSLAFLEGNTIVAIQESENLIEMAEEIISIIDELEAHKTND